MRFRLPLCLLLLLLLALAACNSNSNSTTSGTGVLFLTAQADRTVNAYSLSLSSGSLTTIGSGVATGAAPAAMVVTPAIDALFVANSGANSISSYTINGDGSLTPSSATTATGKTPMGLAVDPTGKFLFVANQGSSDVSVFAISGASLKPVAGSPFTTIPPGTDVPTGPTAVAVPPSGSYVYVANQFTSTVSAFSFGSEGALKVVAGSPFAVGLNPSAVAVNPAGGFLLVANSGSGNVSVFSICAAVSADCALPDGTMSEIKQSPFSAGLQPDAIAFDPGFNFVYVADFRSNSVWQYTFGSGNGVMQPLTPPSISTGTNPVSIAIRSGATGADIGSSLTNPTDYVYVANIGGSSLSGFTLTTSTGVLDVLGSAVTTAGQPSALLTR